MSFDPASAWHVDTRATTARTRSVLLVSVLLTLTPQIHTTRPDADGPARPLVGEPKSPGTHGSSRAAMPQATSTSDVPPTFQVTPATTDHEAIVRDAVDKFTTAGLDLPSLQVVFSADDSDCRGHLGLFESSQQPWRVTICSDLAFVPVHELAHAWIRSNIDEPTRQRYLEFRDKTSWDSPRLDWNERGVEDAAFVVQQNLMADPAGDLDSEWSRRAIAFEFLTGTRSPLRDPNLPPR